MADDKSWQKVRSIWEIIDRLRGENGCPWDRKQTPETVQTYLVEEAHEAAAAVRAQDVEEAAEELGDLLFMVLFMVHLYEERKDFRLDDVCDLISAKMIRRHPHVFGDVTVESAQEVRENWEKIKAGEKAGAGKAPGGIPKSLPALMRAYRLLSRQAQKEGSEWNDLHRKAKDFAARTEELSRDLTAGKTIASSTFGELLKDLADLARLQGYRAEDCLHEVLREE